MIEQIHRHLDVCDLGPAAQLFTRALDDSHVGPREQSEFLQIIEDMKSQIVEIPGGPTAR